MGEFEEKLNAFLANPDAMAQVMNLAQSLNLGGSEQQETPPPPPQQSAGGNPLAGIGDLFSQVDPKLIQRLLPLVGELSGQGSDERLQLLHALGPFLKPERRDKVERAVKAARFIHIGKKLLTTLGDSHV